MSITTRKGYRKNQLAKRYIKEAKAIGLHTNLRQARHAVEAFEKIIKELKPLSDEKKIRVLRATAVLLGFE